MKRKVLPRRHPTYSIARSIPVPVPWTRAQWRAGAGPEGFVAEMTEFATRWVEAITRKDRESAMTLAWYHGEVIDEADASSSATEVRRIVRLIVANGFDDIDASVIPSLVCDAIAKDTMSPRRKMSHAQEVTLIATIFIMLAEYLHRNKLTGKRKKAVEARIKGLSDLLTVAAITAVDSHFRIRRNRVPRAN